MELQNQNLICDTYKLTNSKIKTIAKECKRILNNNGKVFKNKYILKNGQQLEEVKEEPQNVRSETSEESQNQSLKNVVKQATAKITKIERCLNRMDSSDIKYILSTQMVKIHSNQKKISKLPRYQQNIISDIITYFDLIFQKNSEMELHREANKLVKILNAKKELMQLKNKQSLIQEHLENSIVEMKNIFIDPRAVVEGKPEDIEKYKCQVCKGILVQNSTFIADFCSKCKKLYCNGCIRNNYTPCCLSSIGNSNELELQELLPLYNMKFKCRAQECQNQNPQVAMYYSKYIRHLEEKCTSIPVTCPYKCSKTEMTRAQLTTHILEEQCPTERPYCDICSELLENKDAANSHVCYAIVLGQFLHDMVLKRQKAAKKVTEKECLEILQPMTKYEEPDWKRRSFEIRRVSDKRKSDITANDFVEDEQTEDNPFEQIIPRRNQSFEKQPQD